MHILEFKVNYKPEVAAGIELDANTAEDLAADGNYVHLYVPVPSRGITKEYAKSIPRKESLIDEHLLIYRYKMYSEGKTFKQRLIRYCFCSVKQLWFGLKQKQIDVIFAGSTPPFQGVICSWIKKVKKVPFVFNCQDIFPDSMIAAGMTSEGSRICKIGNKIANITYKAADKIIVVSESMRDTLIKKGVASDKIEIVYNWVDEQVIHPVDKKNNLLLKELGIPHYDFTVVYAGNLGYAQGIDVILEAAERLKDDTSIGFVIFGNGALEKEVENRIVECELDRVTIYPLQAYSRVSEVYSIGDVCIVSCKAGTGGFAMPSKTWSIMGCGRAVLACFDRGTYLEKVVMNNECGLFSAAGDADGLTENIKTLASNKELCNRYGKNAREFIEDNLTRNKCTSKICKIIKAVVERPQA